MDPRDLPVLVRPRISDEVYEALQAMILSRRLAPGEQLSLTHIEQQMGISRTPLKEALNRLAHEGLVKIEPRKGTYVADPTDDEISESFDVRRVLEVYAVKLAARNMTPSRLQQIRELVEALRSLVQVQDENQILQEYFDLDRDLHLLIVETSGNGRLRGTWEQVNLHGYMARVRYGTAGTLIDSTQKEHEEILRAFEVGDVLALEQAMSHHIDRVKRSLLQDLARREA